MEPACPVCHVMVKPTDFFCYNCGKNLHPKPPSVTTEDEIKLYLSSFSLPPMGIIWALPYVRQADTKSKTVGYVAIGITVVTLIVLVIETMSFINGISAQVNSQMQGLQGL